MSVSITTLRDMYSWHTMNAIPIVSVVSKMVMIKKRHIPRKIVEKGTNTCLLTLLDWLNTDTLKEAGLN